MRKIPTVARREFSAYFFSPIAYVVGTVFLAAAGFFFYFILSLSRQASLRYTFDIFGFLVVFVAPVLTMRLLAEEKRSGTMEILMTAPVTDWDVVLGKFLACMGYYLALLAATLCYVLVLAKVGSPDYWQMAAGYLGLVLLGCLFISFGMIASALSANQIVAALVGFVPLFILFIISSVVPEPERYAVPTSAGEQIRKVVFAALRYVGVADHLEGFYKGMVDTRDVIYFVSLSLFFLFLTVRITESRKWK